MKPDRFFKWIWNINGLVALIGLILTVLFISYQLISEILTNYNEPIQTLNLADDVKGEENWSLGNPIEISGSNFYYLPLESEKISIESRSEVMNFSGGRYRPTRAKNVMFINSDSNTSNWLFPTTNQLIVNISQLYIRNDSKQALVSSAIYFEMINSDSNNDGIFDDKDERTLALTKVDGSQFSEVISNYSRILETRTNKAGHLFIIYIIENEVYSILVDLNTFKVTNKHQLPRVNAS